MKGTVSVDLPEGYIISQEAAAKWSGQQVPVKMEPTGNAIGTATIGKTLIGLREMMGDCILVDIEIDDPEVLPIDLGCELSVGMDSPMVVKPVEVFGAFTRERQEGIALRNLLVQHLMACETRTRVERTELSLPDLSDIYTRTIVDIRKILDPKQVDNPLQFVLDRDDEQSRDVQGSIG